MSHDGRHVRIFLLNNYLTRLPPKDIILFVYHRNFICCIMGEVAPCSQEGKCICQEGKCICHEGKCGFRDHFDVSETTLSFHTLGALILLLVAT